MEKTYNQIILEVTENYLNKITSPPPPQLIEYDLLKLVNDEIDVYNLGPRDESTSKDDPIKAQYPYQKLGSKRYTPLKVLTNTQIAQILIKLHNASRIATGGLKENPDRDLIGVYNKDGVDKGTYSTSEDTISKLARLYNYNIKYADTKEVIQSIRDFAPRREVNTDKDLIAVNNGIFNYKNKTLSEFSKDIVYLAKSHVNMNFDAKNPKITMHDGEIWDVESWVADLVDDPEIENTIWEIASAVLRPHVPWGRAAWLYSETGNNGKGSLCTLLRNLVGESSCASISLKDFSNSFMLEPLTRANAIIVDENSVGTFIDQADDLKAVTTNDVIVINAKYKQPIPFRFFGFMIQCLNEFPKVRDKSDTFYRRQLFIPMNKKFEGVERKYIKQNYLYRKDVLEYVLKKVLYDSNFYELSIPEESKNVLAEYKTYNDPIRQFFIDVEEDCVWDFLPYTFLYDFYKSWVKENLPEGKPIGRNYFIRHINKLADESEIFETNFDQQVRIKDEMDKPEPLIIEYDLKKWFNKSYKGPDEDILANPKLEGKRFRGIQRKGIDNEI